MGRVDLGLAAALLISLALSSPAHAQQRPSKTSAEHEDSVGSADGGPSPNAGAHAEELSENSQVEPRSREERARDEAAEHREKLAHAAFQRGDSKYLEGDYQAAAEAFQEAYALSGKIEMLFNLANAYERMGKYLEASFALRSYLPHAPEAAKEKLARRVERLTERAREKEAARNAPTEDRKQASLPQAPVPLDRVAGITMITLGIAGTITGVAFGVSALQTRADIKKQCQDSRRLCPLESEALIQRDRTHSLVADISLIGGGLLTVAGIYLVVRKTKTSEVRLEPGFSGAYLGGTF